jgi:hypothetical protein
VLLGICLMKFTFHRIDKSLIYCNYVDGLPSWVE